MSVTPEQLRYHADRSEARGRHATAIFCRQAADEIERLRTWLEVIRDSPELLVITERKAAALALSGNPAPQRREPSR